MRFRLGLLVGFGAGYYFGAKAGRERFHQIEDLLDQVRDAPLVRDLLGQAKEAVADTRERALDAIESHAAGDPTTEMPIIRTKP